MEIVIKPHKETWGVRKGQILYHASVREAGQGYYLGNWTTKKKAVALSPLKLAKMQAHPSSEFKRFLNKLKK